MAELEAVAAEMGRREAVLMGQVDDLSATLQDTEAAYSADTQQLKVGGALMF